MKWRPPREVFEALRPAEDDEVVAACIAGLGLRVEIHLAVGAADADDHDAEALPQARRDQAPHPSSGDPAPMCTCSRFRFMFSDEVASCTKSTTAGRSAVCASCSPPR